MAKVWKALSTPMTKDDIIDSNQASAILGCTRSTIENYRIRGWLHTIRRANGRVLLLREEVERLREEQMARRYKADGIKVVQASAGLERPKRPVQNWPKRPSLRDDPDPLLFRPEVMKALAQYEQSKRERS